MPPHHCVAFENSDNGIQAALIARMPVIGAGPTTPGSRPHPREAPGHTLTSHKRR
ncbi:hypothetical protein ACFY7C_36550 [Streptomyces sp. NPDC012769]|uniref:hypothetical protein n=1 Tax=Streptomyces sp. NPDC012769 TaxID=3364848 RepID=UPI0036ACF127